MSNMNTLGQRLNEQTATDGRTNRLYNILTKRADIIKSKMNFFLLGYLRGSGWGIMISE